MTRQKVLRTEVHSGILERLTEGHWRSGDRLSIEGIARDFDVSPTPVREALASLEQSGLIEYAAHRGYIVAPPLTLEQMGQLVDARQVIERAALTRAFAHWEELVADLRACQLVHAESQREVRSTPEPDYPRLLHYFTADAEFHDAFFRHAGNSYLTEMRENLSWDAHRMRQTWSSGAEQVDAEDAVAEHAVILARVEERNHDGALAALSRHLEAVQRRATSE